MNFRGMSISNLKLIWIKSYFQFSLNSNRNTHLTLNTDLNADQSYFNQIIRHVEACDYHDEHLFDLVVTSINYDVIMSLMLGQLTLFIDKNGSYVSQHHPHVYLP